MTAWQDPVFGPLITCTRDGMSSAEITLLVPAGVGELAELTRTVLGQRRAAGTEGKQFGELLARVAALIDAFPQLASLRVTVLISETGAVCVTGGDGHVAPANRRDPYLRRLRRAPVE